MPSQRRQPTHLVRLALVTLTSLTALAGCQQQHRATHMIEKSGDRAAWRGDYQLASEEYAIVAERQPTRADVRAKYAEALLEVGQAREAREELEVAHTIDPNNHQIIDLLARAMVDSGDVDGAIRFLRIRAEERGTPDEWLRYGQLLAKVNDADGAEAALLAAARGDFGQSMGPQLALAKFYQSIQNDSEAIRRLRMCLYLDPTHDEVYRLLREYGQVPGPTLALEPTEWVEPPRTTSAMPESRQDY